MRDMAINSEDTPQTTTATSLQSLRDDGGRLAIKMALGKLLETSWSARELQKCVFHVAK